MMMRKMLERQTHRETHICIHTHTHTHTQTQHTHHITSHHITSHHTEHTAAHIKHTKARTKHTHTQSDHANRTNWRCCYPARTLTLSLCCCCVCLPLSLCAVCCVCVCVCAVCICQGCIGNAQPAVQSDGGYCLFQGVSQQHTNTRKAHIHTAHSTQSTHTQSTHIAGGDAHGASHMQHHRRSSPRNRGSCAIASRRWTVSCGVCVDMLMHVVPL